MKTDTLFYRLFQRYPDLILALLDLPYGEDSYLFSEKQADPEAFHLSGIFIPVSRFSEQPIVFAEIQYCADDYFYDRFISEIALYLRITTPERHWLAVAIYADRRAEKPASPAFKPFMCLPQLRRIYLEDFQNKPATTLAQQLLGLIVASDQQQAMPLAQALAKRRHDVDSDIVELLEIVLVYKLPHLCREEIKTMLDLTDVELKQTRFYQEMAEEERRKGAQEGSERGRLSEATTLLTRLICRKFGGRVDLAQINNKLLLLSIQQMEDLAEDLLDMHEPGEVVRWLTSRGGR